MYTRQILASTAVGGGTAGILLVRGLTIPRALAAGVAVAVVLRVLLSTIGRVRYWLGRGTGGVKQWQCGDCGRFIHRLGGDWVLTCHHCGWRAGWPGLRWVTVSVPVNQLRRSLSVGQVVVIVAAVGVAIAGVPASAVLSGVNADVGGEGIDSSGTPVTDDPTPNSDGGAGAESTGNTPSVEPPSDADGDGLTDSAEQDGAIGEFQLAGSSPLHKDIYVTVLVGDSVSRLSQEEIRQLEEIWSGMPVENPVGGTGIDIHVRQVAVDRELGITGPTSFQRLGDELYPKYTNSSTACNVYVVALGTVDDQKYTGRGDSPGYFSVADGSLTKSYDQPYSERVTVITHELLHNVVGTFDDGTGHTEEGWLNGNKDEVYGENLFMSEKTAQHLSEGGFDRSGYYQNEYC